MVDPNQHTQQDEDELNISKALKKLGVDDKEIEKFLSDINGVDYINLVNSLDSEDPKDKSLVKNILAKYNNGIRENKDMSFDRLYALYKGVQDTGKITEVMKWLTPINEDTPGDHALARDGYNYSVKVDGPASEKFMDWLDKNKIKYLMDDGGLFHIRCKDRDEAYRVDNAVDKLGAKKVVRDSALAEGAKEKAKKQENKAKAKLANLKPANPVAKAMATNPKKAGPMKDKKDQKDPIKGKHKKRIETDESIQYYIGESVMVGEQTGVVKIPNGPDNTVGIMFEGILSMVDNIDVSRIDEDVMGMTQVNPLFRLRELAGLPPAPATELSTAHDDDDSFDDVSIDEPDLVGSGEVDDESFDTDEPDVDSDDFDFGSDTDEVDFSDDDGFDDESNFDEPPKPKPFAFGSNPLEPKSPSISSPPLPPTISKSPLSSLPPTITPSVSSLPKSPTLGGVPGDLPSSPTENVPTTGPSVSEAMGDIQDHLNNIQAKLSDIRLNEYKALVRKLQDLANQVQSMGKDYLGEERKMKENARRLNSRD